MRTDELDYDLPPELIAQRPAARRDRARLLVLDRTGGRLDDRVVTDLPRLLRAGDCLVLNDTRVLPGRFWARRPTGAMIEGLFLESPAPGRWKVMLRNARRVHPGQSLDILDRHGHAWSRVQAAERLEEGLWLLTGDALGDPVTILGEIGAVPLPPYIRRDAAGPSTEDAERYQTVYARQPGAIAAPTAGLHFTPELLDNLAAVGVTMARVTLHVGAGTFRPVATERLEDHPMHAERYALDPANAEIINTSIENGGRVIPVGTTSVRTLETVARGRRVEAGSGTTRLFIRPGFRFQVTDAMMTNFHLPRSTLLVLVAAFAGLDTIRAAYQHAIEQRYRFYSYGDAMLIL
ncbi:MAG TPA: tRNA preQ1(34) S-adenosylmethionine ribosyltransferase-isomerase QueA [Phycisphaerales bacterium]|nr:tRNA preQ1(34) S-adenosylmethionine ribosyltransferase-isomerase QueA [Phycisphaerales bacterium]